jgi:AraC-like DNA-binding protein
MTISCYLRNVRLEHAATLLKSGTHNVTEAAMAVGYSSLSYFSRAFVKMFDTCPCVFGFQQEIKGIKKLKKKNRYSKS